MVRSQDEWIYGCGNTVLLHRTHQIVPDPEQFRLRQDERGQWQHEECEGRKGRGGRGQAGRWGSLSGARGEGDKFTDLSGPRRKTKDGSTKQEAFCF